MAWWRRSLKLSVLWVILVFGLAAVGLWYIGSTEDPSMLVTGYERGRQLGQGTLGLLTLGLLAIWGLAYERRHIKGA